MKPKNKLRIGIMVASMIFGFVYGVWIDPTGQLYVDAMAGVLTGFLMGLVFVAVFVGVNLPTRKTNKEEA